MRTVLRSSRACRAAAALVAVLGLVGAAVVVAPLAFALDATSVSVSCSSSQPNGQSQSCVVAVSDLASSVAFGGAVSLSASGAGAFLNGGNNCTLTAGLTPTCSVSYVPQSGAGSAQTITASYAGDSQRAGSTGTGTLTLAPDPTSTAVSCGAGSSADVAQNCTVTVTDTTTVSAPITIAGTVSLSGSGGTSSGGCTINNGSCNLMFTPSAYGTGTQQVQASFTPADATQLAASTGTGSLTVLPDVTATRVSCTPVVNKAVATEPQNCTVTVTDTTQPSTKPSGTVTVAANGSGSYTGSNSCPLSAGSCTVTYAPAGYGTGSQQITARYPGTAGFTASSGSTTLEIKSDATGTQASCGPAAPQGVAQTCTATVTDGLNPALTPTGSIAFAAGTTLGSFGPGGGTCTLHNGTCSVTFTPSSFDGGSLNVSVYYTSNSPAFLGIGSAVAATTTLIISADTTATGVSCGPAGSVGAAQTCTATVSDSTVSSAVPSGTVRFGSSGSGSFTSSTCTLANGTCTVTFTPSQSAPATMTAAYQGASGYAASSSSTALQVSDDATSIAVSCPRPRPAGIAQPCDASVTDTATSAAVIGGGTVDFTASGDGTFPNGTSCTLSGGSCEVDYRPAADANTQTITASFEAEPGYLASTGSGTLTFGSDGTQTAVSCGPEAAAGTAQTCTATVQDTDTLSMTPTGTVQFAADGDGSFGGDGACTLESGSCSVSYTASDPGDGSQNVTATYQGGTGFYGSSSTGVLAIQADPTTTAADCSLSPGGDDEAYCEVTVMDPASPSALPAGSVQWSSSGGGTFSAVSCTLADDPGDNPYSTGSYCFTFYTASGIDGHGQTVTATYPGNGGYTPSAATATVTLPADTTGTSVSCGSAAAAGTAQTCTVTVTNTGTPSRTPTGTVDVSADGAGTFGDGSSGSAGTSCTLSGGSCTVNYTPTRFGSGTQTVTAGYQGDTNNSASSSTTALTIAPDISTTSVSCGSAAPLGGARTCTATVAGASSSDNPTGTITFSSDGDGSFGGEDTCTLSGGSCSVDYTPSDFGSGTQTITADYPGDGAFIAGSGTATLAITPDATATSVSCGPAAAAGTAQPCTVTVADTTTPSTTPSGSVALSSDGNGSFGSGGTCTLDDGSCTLNYTPSSAGTGTQQITATYRADKPFAAGSSSTALTISADATSTSVSCGPTAAVGKAQRCTVFVIDTAASSATPTGTVHLTSDGSGSFTGTGDCTLSSGACSILYTPSQFGSGSQTITAAYHGDLSRLAGQATTTLVVHADAISTTVACGPAAAVGTAQLCTATVADATHSSTTPTGTIRMTSNGKGSFDSGATCTLAGGSCSLHYTPTSVGSTLPTITASYQPDAGWAVGSARSTVQVSQDATSTSLTCGAAAAAGRAQRCTAVVADLAAPASTPSGTLQFSSDGSGTFGSTTCKLWNATCSVTYTPSGYGTGTQDITAAYPGDAGHNASSATTALIVLAAATSTTLSCGPAASAGTAQTCTVKVNDAPAPSTAPTGSVQLTANGTGSFGGGGSCMLNAGTCTVTYTPAAFGTGSQAIKATYAGDTGFLTSVRSAILTVTKDATSATLTCTPGSTAATWQRCTAAMSDATTPTSAPSGAVSLTTDGTGVFERTSCPLAQGSCSFNYTPAKGSGQQTLTASYPGDRSHTATSATAGISRS